MVKKCSDIYNNNKYNNIFNEYPFELDHFQKHTIEGIENNVHVLNTAHTGSGKTLGAEYIIKKFCSMGKKVIYTSPIKSLSNQKFYEFNKKFPEISFGILTGDIKFNPEADCLIMTTEILRNFVFQKKMDNVPLYFEMNIEDLAWVIFDEVHYINDIERGKVWEETMISLPNHTRFLLLSATINRPIEFAQWIETITGNDVWYASTNKRVVPLTHYSYLTLRSKLSEVHGRNDKIVDNEISKPIVLKDANQMINNTNYNKVKHIADYFSKNRLYVNHTFVLNSIVSYLNVHNLLPAIFFVFSRKKAEEYAHKISLSLNDGKTMNIIKSDCNKLLISKLSNYREYINTPEYTDIIKLLEKGIAVHHSGIHPIFKEIIEMMFLKGYIKILFATETFSVGINMPTKSVVFTSLQKYDGTKFRYLYPHEYTQMAGRAGRRGLDKHGHVFHLNNLFELPTLNEYTQLLCGKAQTLSSKFQIDFHLILRLLSIGCENIPEFIEKSMLQKSIMQECLELKNEIKEMKHEIQQSTQTINNHIKTPLDKIIEYDNLFKQVEIIRQQKKRKKIKRQMGIIRTNFKDFEKDYKKYSNLKEKEKQLGHLENNLELTKNYIIDRITLVKNILTYYFYIKKDTTALTIKGQMAALIQEVNCLVFAEKLQDHVFDNLLPEELACIFSCFSNVSIPINQRMVEPKGISNNIRNIILSIESSYNTFNQINIDYNIYGETENNMHFELCETILKWCHATNEKECIEILEEIKKRGIFIGEFVKTILKINCIAHELEKICELQNNMNLLHTLKKIPTMILKSIAENQSLYV